MPSWLDNPDWTAHYDKGFQQGLQLRQQGMREQEFAQRRKEFDVETELRNRQFQLQQVQIASQVIGNLSKQTLNTQTQAGFAALDQVMANANELGGWDSPDFQKEFWTVAKRYPQVQLAPQFSKYTDLFKASEAANAKVKAAEISAERYRLDRESRENIARKRNEASVNRVIEREKGLTERAGLRADKPVPTTTEERNLFDAGEKLAEANAMPESSKDEKAEKLKAVTKATANVKYWKNIVGQRAPNVQSAPIKASRFTIKEVK